MSTRLRVSALALALGSCGAREIDRAGGGSAPGPEARPRAAGGGAGGAEAGAPASPIALAPGDRAPARARCFGSVTPTGTVRDPRLEEISALVASRRQPGILWAHNDSGEPHARFFAIDTAGTVRAEIEIDGAPHLDWEDAAAALAPDGRERLYFADAGDNGARDGSLPPRDHAEIIVVEPPLVPPGEASAPLHVSSFEVLPVAYPDGPHDCEAIFVDGATGDLYLLSKANEGPHALYRAPAPHPPGEPRVLERVMELLPGRSLADAVTAADADESGGIAIRTYRQAFYFPRPFGGSVRDALASAPLTIGHLGERQGEAIAIASDRSGVFTISEGRAETLHFVPFVDCP